MVAGEAFGSGPGVEDDWPIAREREGLLFV